MSRSQLHKIRVQGISSDGREQPALNPTLANQLVDQASTAEVADSYQFAENTFATPAGTEPLTYSASAHEDIVFTAATRTFNWTLVDPGIYRVIVYATNSLGKWVSDDFTITVT